MDKKILYINRNYEDVRDNLVDLTNAYFPDLGESFDDASLGRWIVDITAAVGDELAYHTDRVLQETSITAAQQRSSLLSLARSNGLRIPGPKASMTEVEFSCELPVFNPPGESASTIFQPSWDFAPVIKKGTKLSSGKIVFEVMDNIDFKEQFNSDGFSDRKILPKRDANGRILKYEIRKLATVVSGESRIFKKVIRPSDIIPFMEIVLPDINVQEVSSIIVKPGTNYQADPHISEFQLIDEFTPGEKTITKTDVYRFFETDALVQQQRWGEVVKKGDDGKIVDGVTPVIYKYGYNIPNDGGAINVVQTAAVTKGEWKFLKQKFITEYTDRGYLKIIFGSGSEQGRKLDITNASDFAKYQITKMISNDNLGVLPPINSTLYVLYRVGGGQEANVAVNTVNKILFLNAEFGCITKPDDQNIINAVRASLKVTNIIPSVSGKDAPSENEIRNLIRYNNGAQDRCVTVKDYYSRIMQMPSKYGTPFRHGVTEENNKIMLYLLGVDWQGYLTDILPEALVSNIEGYLSEYRMINDFVEIKSGRIVNLSFEVDIFCDRSYNKNDVVSNVITVVKEYMDIQKHQMGEDIYVGDLMKEIGKVDGVLNLIDFRVYNEYGEQYSTTQTTQPIKVASLCEFNSEYGGESTEETALANRFEIDLKASDYLLFNDNDAMFEVKYPTKDIRIRVKTR